MERAPHLLLRWRGLPTRSCDGEHSLSHGPSNGPPISFALRFYHFCLQSRGLKVVEYVLSDDDTTEAASLVEGMLQF
jgi:hypothetical protein